MGAQRKVVVFTESRRTQRYLKDYLDANGCSGRTVIFNGTNTDPESRDIYEKWLFANKDTGRISDVQSADRRNAILDYFRDTAEIFIATESAAEGINLQFCSLVINYDLPWNPQRIEQRIGRCHRYGRSTMLLSSISLMSAMMLTDRYMSFLNTNSSCLTAFSALPMKCLEVLSQVLILRRKS